MNKSEQLRRFQPIARLRRIRGGKEAEPSKVGEALTRIAQSPDGKIFLDWLWLQTRGKSVPADASDSAFRDHNANCILFDRILNLVEDKDVGTGRQHG